MQAVSPAPPDVQEIEPATAAMNAEIAAKLKVTPDLWSFPAEVVRDARRQGRGIFPLSPASPRARVEAIDGRAGKVPIRVIAPEAPRGAYLHLHGGGWMLGQAYLQDGLLERLADECGLACVSVDYRLAPEHPFPAGPDDCEAAALWLVENAESRFGTRRLFIGGESAGANLSLVTLLRLRDRLGSIPFSGANLVAGCFDLGLTPSARLWGQRGLILDTRDIRQFVRAYLSQGEDPRHPSISPLYADLKGMPPVLLSVGTMEALLDDSLFMAARLQASGCRASLKIWPGGVHVFRDFDFPMARRALAHEIAFLNGLP